MLPALVTDSNSQLPAELRDRFEVEVVPITVVIDGTDYREGVDLDADGFYDLLATGPEVSTSQPSPGDFVDAYQRCIDRGHDEIVSIHVSAELSGTLNAARIAAGMVDADVHLVDTATASFGIACCVWQAALARAACEQPSDAAATMIAAAEDTAGRLYSVTALGAAKLLNASGRVDFTADESGIPLFKTAPGGVFDQLGSVGDFDAAADAIVSAMHLDGAPIRVALGMADAASVPYYEALETRLADRDDVVEVIRYRIGPSVGALTGAGTAGGFWYPAG